TATATAGIARERTANLRITDLFIRCLERSGSEVPEDSCLQDRAQALIAQELPGDGHLHAYAQVPAVCNRAGRDEHARGQVEHPTSRVSHRCAERPMRRGLVLAVELQRPVHRAGAEPVLQAEVAE